MANGHLTKELFLELPDREKWGWIFDTLSPLSIKAEQDNSVRNFLIGLTISLGGIGTIGAGAVTLIQWVNHHFH